MQTQIDNIERDLKDLKDALVGNEFNGKGLVQRVDAIEKYQQDDKKTKWTIAGGFAVIMFLINYFK